MKIVSLNISEKKGVVKTPVETISLNMNGLLNDAHAGPWHRQVSILGSGSIQRFSQVLGRKIIPGEFAENITLQEFEADMVAPLDILSCGDVILEVTQIGKKCHGTNCAIFKQTGDCVMPGEGVFCRVLNGGLLKKGDSFEFAPKLFRILVITLSDRCYAGVNKDISGPAVSEKVKELMEQNNRKYSIDKMILPDDPVMLAARVSDAFSRPVDVIITTGSTGIGPRDIAPGAIKPLLDREIPGIMDMIRLKYGMEKPGALLSRAIAGTKAKTLLFAIPGSPKAVNEYMDEINKIIFHCFNMLYSIDNH